MVTNPAVHALDILISMGRHRPAGATEWFLPRGGHPLAAGIFPFCVSKDRFVRPIGTAFSISELSLVASAHHNVANAIEDSWRGAELASRDPKEWPDNLHLPDIGLCIIHQIHTTWPDGTVSIVYLPRVCSSRGTDLLVADFYLAGHEPFKVAQLPLSFSVPRVGEKLKCVGYANMKANTKEQSDRFSIDDLESKDFDLLTDAHLQLKVTEGRVKHIFLEGLADGFAQGPCAVIDCETDHGQSGGPVFNEAGFVCGVLSAGASLFFPSNTSIVGLLYPAYVFDAQIASGDASRPAPVVTLRELVEARKILTDGLERRLRFGSNGGKTVVYPAIHSDDAGNVFENFAAFQAKRPSHLLGPIRLRVGRHTPGRRRR